MLAPGPGDCPRRLLKEKRRLLGSGPRVDPSGRDRPRQCSGLSGFGLAHETTVGVIGLTVTDAGIFCVPGKIAGRQHVGVVGDGLEREAARGFFPTSRLRKYSVAPVVMAKLYRKDMKREHAFPH